MAPLLNSLYDGGFFGRDPIIVTKTPTASVSQSYSPSVSFSPTATPTSHTPTPTPTNSPTSHTPTPTPTRHTPTPTPSFTARHQPKTYKNRFDESDPFKIPKDAIESPDLYPTPTETPTQTPTSTGTPTKTPTNTNTPTGTPTHTPSNSNTPTGTPPNTPTPSNTPPVTVTPTPTISKSATQTPSISVTHTPKTTPTVSITHTPKPTPHVTYSPSMTVSNTPPITPSLSPSTTPPPPIPLNKDVLAWYRFGDSIGSDNIYDYSCNGYDLISLPNANLEKFDFNGVGTQRRANPKTWGDALLIPKNSQYYLQCALSRYHIPFPNLDVTTILCWFKLPLSVTGLTGSHTMFSVKANNTAIPTYEVGFLKNAGLYLKIRNSYFDLSYDPNYNNSNTGDSTYADGNWHTLVLQVDATNPKKPLIGFLVDGNGYRAGQKYNQLDLDLSNDPILAGFNSILNVGQSFSGSSNYVGSIDELVFFPKMLNSAEIQQVFDVPSSLTLCVSKTPTQTPSTSRTPTQTPTPTPTDPAQKIRITIYADQPQGINLYNLLTKRVAYSGVTDFTAWDTNLEVEAWVTINPNVRIGGTRSGNTTYPAFSVSGFPPRRAFLTIINKGEITGCGGYGGASQSTGGQGGTGFYADYPCTLINESSGYFYGGGGGGGGGKNGTVVGRISQSCPGTIPCGYNGIPGCFFWCEGCADHNNYTCAHYCGDYCATTGTCNTSIRADDCEPKDCNCPKYHCCSTFHTGSTECDVYYTIEGGFGGVGGDAFNGPASGGSPYPLCPDQAEKGPADATNGASGGVKGNRGTDLYGVSYGGPPGYAIYGMGVINFTNNNKDTNWWNAISPTIK